MVIFFDFSKVNNNNPLCISSLSLIKIRINFRLKYYL